jgi:UDP-N-acetyl-2-amino-2-deoxyglucuronate dehydrogenase
MNLNFAIIGCGRIAKRHAEQIVKHGTLAAVCDVVAEKADELAAQYGTTAFYSPELLFNSGIKADWVIICTPNGLHAAHAVQALEAGCNVLCEKPLCINAADGQKMMAAAATAEKKLFVVKQNRYNPPVAFLKQLLDDNRLGKIFSFQVNCFWNRPPAYYSGWKGTLELDGGTLFTQFSHFIDLLYWLLGDVEKVEAVTANYHHPANEIEDTGMVLFTLKTNVTGSLNYTVNSFAKNMEGSFTIFGEKGTVKIGGQYLNELEYFEADGIAMPDLPKGNPANGYGFYQGSMSNHDKVYEHLIASLSTPSEKMVSAEDGLKTVEIIERIYKAAGLK